MLNFAIYSAVYDAGLSAANAKLFDITEPKKAAAVSLIASSVELVALTIFFKIIERFKNRLSNNGVGYLVGASLVGSIFISAYAAHWVSKKSGNEVTLKQIAKLVFANLC